ncbi:hypothetical protein A3A70_02255 [candidate division WWE3 bacterium RIFCSPLOWO2_01_FULL_42_11]|uniref:Uncharacterized protein n=1 Tax=candidate division WWE3 bacterium RIFCSPLOWO2_01_FULL_42_11 TaxID=1802627 RepID=A0A1F4VQ85_UNCKA|nr:MAG: hypothetical protein A3A70_02255 [candidate division WWE3 bacterium RIFCSPLOWO2_01_FULL_42_11]
MGYILTLTALRHSREGGNPDFIFPECVLRAGLRETSPHPRRVEPVGHPSSSALKTTSPRAFEILNL